MEIIEKRIQERLFELQDIGYKHFHAKLIPTVDPDTIIGVRTPILRRLAKEVAKTDYADDFMKILPHKYYDENNLHGLIIETVKDFGKAVELINEFLPYIDNWATCDIISPSVFKTHPDELLVKIKEWIRSDKTYAVRFGLKMLMNHYLDDSFREEYLSLAASVKSEEYYVNMMIAWFFATALAKQYDAAVPFIEQKRLDTWIHNKTIQKSAESLRISAEKKVYLRKFRTVVK